MKRKALAFMLVMILATVFVVTGCSQETTVEPEEVKSPIKIGGLTSLSGALQDYGVQMQRGFMLGLEYATDGTMAVAGRSLEVIWEDTTTVPDVARERALKLLDEDKVDMLVGPASSADAAALLGLAEEYEKLLMIEPAAADFLTGANWNRYAFRTGRSTAQDANAMAAVIMHNKPNAKVATLAPDSAFGHASVDPFVAALAEKGGELLIQEFPPADTTDFTPFILRIRQEKPDFLYVIWAGANNPWGQLMELNLQEEGIEITTGAPEIAALKMMGDLAGMHGFTVYYHGVAQNPINEWLVTKHKEKYNSPPDIFTSGGMAAAMALVTALEKTEGNTDTELLIETLRGMEFESPTGKRWFREEDHQAMQPLFEIKLEEVSGVDHIVPTLVRVIPAEEVAPPITVPANAKR